jgi:hypothetical protein
VSHWLPETEEEVQELCPLSAADLAAHLQDLTVRLFPRIAAHAAELMSPREPLSISAADLARELRPLISSN